MVGVVESNGSGFESRAGPDAVPLGNYYFFLFFLG